VRAPLDPLAVENDPAIATDTLRTGPARPRTSTAPRAGMG
jgi:hypothetical protein